MSPQLNRLFFKRASVGKRSSWLCFCSSKSSRKSSTIFSSAPKAVYLNKGHRQVKFSRLKKSAESESPIDRQAFETYRDRTKISFFDLQNKFNPDLPLDSKDQPLIAHRFFEDFGDQTQEIKTLLKDKDSYFGHYTDQGKSNVTFHAKGKELFKKISIPDDLADRYKKTEESFFNYTTPYISSTPSVGRANIATFINGIGISESTINKLPTHSTSDSKQEIEWSLTMVGNNESDEAKTKISEFKELRNGNVPLSFANSSQMSQTRVAYVCEETTDYYVLFKHTQTTGSNTLNISVFPKNLVD